VKTAEPIRTTYIGGNSQMTSTARVYFVGVKGKLFFEKNIDNAKSNMNKISDMRPKKSNCNN